MKKFIILILAVILICSNAAADIGDIVEMHNLCCAAAGAAKLTGDPEQDGDQYTYSVNNVRVIFDTENGDLKTFACICLDESGVSEFLAQCVTSFYSVGGLSAYVDCFDPLLSDFLKARSGETPGSNKFVPGVLFDISKQSFGYMFILSKVK